MLILITYDVTTVEAAGRRRLRRVAKTCESYGVRVQKSVFECQVDRATWIVFRDRLLGEIDPKEDSLRFYFLGEKGFARCEQHGQGVHWDMEGPLIL